MMTTTGPACTCTLCRLSATGQPASIELRCRGAYRGKRCNRLLAELVAPPYRVRCDRCKYVNQHVGAPVVL